MFVRQYAAYLSEAKAIAPVFCRVSGVASWLLELDHALSVRSRSAPIAGKSGLTARFGA